MSRVRGCPTGCPLLDHPDNPAGWWRCSNHTCQIDVPKPEGAG